MIVQVRGGVASGKSTLVRRLLQEHGGVVVAKEPGMVPLWRCDGDLYVLGRYNLEYRYGIADERNRVEGTGGDQISGKDSFDRIVRDYAIRQLGLRHLVWESLRGSTEPSFKSSNDARRAEMDRWRAEIKELGITWAVLSTSKEQARENLRLRQLERVRDQEDANQGNFNTVHSCAAYAMGANEIRVETLEWPGRAYAQLHRLLEGDGWVCSSSQCTANEP